MKTKRTSGSTGVCDRLELSNNTLLLVPEISPVLPADEEDDPDDTRRRLKMKGQMLHMADWDAVLFLGTPM